MAIIQICVVHFSLLFHNNTNFGSPFSHWNESDRRYVKFLISVNCSFVLNLFPPHCLYSRGPPQSRDGIYVITESHLNLVCFCVKPILAIMQMQSIPSFNLMEWSELNRRHHSATHRLNRSSRIYRLISSFHTIHTIGTEKRHYMETADGEWSGVDY